VRAVVLLVVLGLLAAGASAVSAGAAPRARPHPKLFVSTAPALRVRGVGFKPRERVTVTLGAPRLVRRVRASRAGGFTLSFGAVRLNRCGGISVTAVGSLGSIASAHLQRPACMPLGMPA
jgi:hypothetical protein